MNKQAMTVIVFTCNWDGLSCIEAAAQEGLDYPASTRVVRVSCLSRVNQGLMLKAFELGAAGVMLLGCEPENCQFNTDATYVIRECEKAQMVLRMLGLGEERLMLCQMPSGDCSGFVGQVTGFIKRLEQMQIPEAARI